MSTWFHYRSATTLLGRVSYPLHPYTLTLHLYTLALHPYTLTLHLYTLALHPYTLTYFKPNGRLFYKFSMPLPDFPKNNCEGAFLERAKEKFKRKVKDKARTWINLGVWSRHVIYKPSHTRCQKHFKSSSTSFAMYIYTWTPLNYTLIRQLFSNFWKLW